MARFSARRAGRHAVLGCIVAAMLFPVVWALVTSFKPANELFGVAPLPVHPSLANYRTVFARFPLFRLLFNTFLTASGVTALQLAVAVPAAYAMVRLRPRWGRLLRVAVGGALVIPAQSLIIPQFLLVSRLGWRDSLLGLVVPQVAGCALAVLLLCEHLRAVPLSLFGAAALDGATAGEALRHVALPALRPALGAVATLVFISTWNEYLWPMLVAPSFDHTTIQMGLQLFQNQEGPDYGPLLAAAMLSTLPVVGFYLCASRRVADAFLHSGIR